MKSARCRRPSSAKLRRLGALLALLLVGASGCGYSLVRYRGGLGEDLRTLAIVTPENDSYEPGLEVLVAEALRREVLRRRGIRLVEDPAAADLVIAGRVLPIRARGRSFSSLVQALEYELTLRVELSATRRSGEALALDPRSLQETERYLASADVEVERTHRLEALRRAASLVAGRVYDSLYESQAP